MGARRFSGRPQRPDLAANAMAESLRRAIASAERRRDLTILSVERAEAEILDDEARGLDRSYARDRLAHCRADIAECNKQIEELKLHL